MFFAMSEQLIRFAIIGVLNTVIGYGVYYLLLFLRVHYMIAAVASFVFGTLNSFIWNKLWVFRSPNRPHAELPKFVAVYLATLCINLIFLPVLVEGLKIDPRIAQLFFIFILPLFTFLGHKYWSFA